VVAGICRCLFAETGTYEVFNLGTGVTTPVRQVIDILRHAFDDPRPVVEDRSKLRGFDRKSLTPDIRKIRSTVGWEPKISIEDGLRELARSSMAAQGLSIDPSGAPV
jgi:nucleoside-diphosphate-sugar epimerase